jgi:hypothetical protein
MPNFPPEAEVLDGPEAIVFLAELGLRITIMARDGYLDPDHIDIEKLRAANEVLHAVSSKLCGLARGIERYPTDDFLAGIRERAGPAFSTQLEWAIADSLKALEATPSRPSRR